MGYITPTMDFTYIYMDVCVCASVYVCVCMYVYIDIFFLYFDNREEVEGPQAHEFLSA